MTLLIWVSSPYDRGLAFPGEVPKYFRLVLVVLQLEQRVHPGDLQVDRAEVHLHEVLGFGVFEVSWPEQRERVEELGVHS